MERSVLHGGTGVSDEDMKRCVREGMKKINVGTELNKNYIEVVSKTFTADDVTPLTSLRNLLGPANDRYFSKKLNAAGIHSSLPHLMNYII